MKLYYEFQGTKLKGTECYTFVEAKMILAKITDQCSDQYRKKYNKCLAADDELVLHKKILARLKLKIIVA